MATKGLILFTNGVFDLGTEKFHDKRPDDVYLFSNIFPWNEPNYNVNTRYIEVPPSRSNIPTMM